MSFSQGFSKTAAGIPGAGVAGTLFGSAKKGVKGLAEGIQASRKATGESFTRSMRQAMGKPAIGASVAQKSVMNNPEVQSLAQKRIEAVGKMRGSPLSQEEAQKISLQTAKRHLPAETAQKAQEVKARLQNIRSIRTKNKQSFASKHPVLTGVGTYAAMQAAFGGGQENQQPAPPPVAYGGQYY